MLGLGLPLLRLTAEQTGGSLDIQSTQGVGTTLTARFQRRHLDCPPLGDLAGTVALLIQGSPEVELAYRHTTPRGEAALSTAELREILGHLVREAQEQGKLRRDLPTEELVEVFLGIYLLALMGWEDMEHCTEDVCRRRVGRVMDQVLAGLAET